MLTLLVVLSRCFGDKWTVSRRVRAEGTTSFEPLQQRSSWHLSILLSLEDIPSCIGSVDVTEKPRG